METTEQFMRTEVLKEQSGAQYVMNGEKRSEGGRAKLAQILRSSREATVSFLWRRSFLCTIRSAKRALLGIPNGKKEKKGRNQIAAPLRVSVIAKQIMWRNL